MKIKQYKKDGTKQRLHQDAEYANYVNNLDSCNIGKNGAYSIFRVLPSSPYSAGVVV